MNLQNSLEVSLYVDQEKLTEKLLNFIFLYHGGFNDSKYTEW